MEKDSDTGRGRRIEARLRGEFAPDTFHLRDVSAAHRHHTAEGQGGGGSETHFEVTIGGGRLRGMTRLAVHRAVNDALADEFASGLHALQIRIV